MRITLFYFSGTGNTKAACDLFKEKLEHRNATIILINIEDITDGGRIEDTNSDIIGFAYPVYGADLPRIFRDFLSNVNPRVFSKKEAFVITTAGYINAYGPFLLKKELSKKGLVLKNHIVVKMPNSTKKSDNNEIRRYRSLAKQEKKIEKLAGSLLDGRGRFYGVGPWLLGGYIIRVALKKPMAEHYKKLQVDDSVCTHCKTCINNCPTQAIRYVNGTFTFTAACTTCFRCVQSCPVHAIKNK